MNWKQRALAFAAAFCSLGAANAAGPYEGIYQTSGNFYISIHQGLLGGRNHIFMTGYQTVQTTAANRSSPYNVSVGPFQPELFNYWQLLGGDQQADSSFLVEGYTDYEFCFTKLRVTLDASNNLVIEHLSSSPRNPQNPQNYTCTVNPKLTATRIF